MNKAFRVLNSGINKKKMNKFLSFAIHRKHPLLMLCSDFEPTRFDVGRAHWRGRVMEQSPIRQMRVRNHSAAA